MQLKRKRVDAVKRKRVDAGEEEEGGCSEEEEGGCSEEMGVFCCCFQAMAKARQDHNTAPASPNVIPEYRVWEEHWIR